MNETLIEELVDEARHIISVQHLRLEPGDILAFVVSGAPLSKQDQQAARAGLRKHVPEGVEVAVVWGGHFAVLKEQP